MGSSGFTYGSLPGSGVSYGTNAKGADDYTVLNVSTDDAVTVDASIINSNVKTINASTSGGEVVLVGNANADALYAGTGGSTLFGGTAGTKAVKDALYGGAGTDYFVFTSQEGEKGKETDIAYNYQAGDVIVLDKAPDSITANGTTITLTWNETPEGSSKPVASTFVINGEAQDSAMKKFNAIDASVEVTFAIGSISDEDGTFDLSGATNTYKYKFDVADSKSDNAKALKKGVAWSDVENYIKTDSSSQYAATDGWFEEIVSTDNASVSELDSILDAKGALNGDLAQLDGDAFFTNTAFDSKAAAITGARHQAKK